MRKRGSIKYFVLLILFLWMGCGIGRAQKTVSSFQHFTVEDGLSHVGVSNIFEDSKGFLWISTTDGLNRYDGKAFQTYFHSETDTSTISSNTISNIVEDGKQNLILGGGKGIDIYIRDENYFSHVIPHGMVKGQDNSVLNLLQDIQGHTWVANRNDLREYDSLFHLLNIYNRELAGKDILWNIKEDKSGNIWVNKGGTLNKINPKSNTIYNKNNNPEGCRIFTDSVNGYVFSENGDLWAEIQNNTLARYSPKGVFKEAVLSFDFNNQILKNLFIGRSGQLWLTTVDRGVYHYDPFANTTERFVHDATNWQSICNNNTDFVYEDRFKNIWFATFDGLDLLPYKACEIRVWDIFGDTTKLPKTDDVSSLIVCNDTLWVGVWSKGICSIDLQTGKRNFYRVGPTELENFVWDLIKVGNDLWFGNYNGLHRFNIKTKKVEGFNADPTYPREIDSLAVISFKPDRNQNIWMSLGGAGGVLKYNLISKKFEHILSGKNSANEFPYRHYDAIDQDKTGAYWFGYRHSIGLVKSDDGKSFRIINKPDGSPLFPDIINALLADGDFLWIGSNSGLYKLNIITYKFTKYSRENGLPSNYVHSMLKADNSIWVSTDNGLAEMNPATGQFYSFNTRYDLPENTVFGGILDSNTHRLYFTTPHTVFTFDCNKLSKKTTILKPIITALKVMGEHKRVNPDSIVELESSDQYFSIEFTAPYFPSATTNKYAYKLEGFDNDWVFVNSRQFAHYTNLSYGNYTFRLKATTDNTHWYEMDKPLKIRINTPFYFKTWFIVLCILFVIANIGMIMYVIYKIKLQKLLYSQKIRNKIASDLHDDIGSTLSSISFMSEIAKQKSKTGVGESEKWFDQIGESSRTIIENMNDIVWSVNPQHDTFESLLIRMRKFASSILEAKDISLVFDADDRLNAIKLGMEERKNLFLLFKEIINNMARHSNCRRVSIGITRSSDRILLLIEDDGRGFDVGAEYLGNGLKNIQKRALELNAELLITSEKGKGSKFTLLL